MIMNLNWNRSTESTCFSADLFCGQCGVRASGTTRVRVLWGKGNWKKKRARELTFEKWMDLETVIQSEVSQQEKKNQVLYIKSYMWNLEKWYRWTYLQGRNRDADTENRCVDPGGGGVVGWIGRLGLAYIQLMGSCCVAQPGALW